MFLNEAQHVHLQINNTSGRGVTKAQKEVIRKLFDDGVTKPKHILSAFKARNLDPPSTVQLNRYLVNYRKKKYGGATINANDLIKWCEDRTEVPGNVDQPFVLSHRINIDQATKTSDLGIFLTTLRLLKIATKSSFVQTDSTYKLNWQGNLIIIFNCKNRA